MVREYGLTWLARSTLPFTTAERRATLSTAERCATLCRRESELLSEHAAAAGALGASAHLGCRVAGRQAPGFARDARRGSDAEHLLQSLGTAMRTLGNVRTRSNEHFACLMTILTSVFVQRHS